MQDDFMSAHAKAQCVMDIPAALKKMQFCSFNATTFKFNDEILQSITI